MTDIPRSYNAKKESTAKAPVDITKNWCNCKKCMALRYVRGKLARGDKQIES